METSKYRVTPDAHVSDIDLESEEFVLPDGSRLTEARAEELADAAERRRANLIPGRKSLSGNGAHSPVIQVRVPADLQHELIHIADSRGVSLSKAVRDILAKSVGSKRSA